MLATIAFLSTATVISGCSSESGDLEDGAVADGMDGGRRDGSVDPDRDADTVTRGEGGTTFDGALYDGAFEMFGDAGLSDSGFLRDASLLNEGGPLDGGPSYDGSFVDGSIVDAAGHRDASRPDGSLEFFGDGGFGVYEAGFGLDHCVPACEAPAFCCPRMRRCVPSRDECETFPEPPVPEW